MTKQIVIPLDGSHLAEMALPHAVALAHANLFGLTLLRFAPPPVIVSSTAWAVAPAVNSYEDWEEEMTTEKAYLEAVALRLRSLGVEVKTHLLEDEPAQGIITFVEQHPEVAMIAMSTHGRSGLNRWVFGSVAEKVLHSSPVPLLLVRSKERDALPEDIPVPLYRNILVPLDGSEFAAQALEQARTLATCTNATLTLVSAVPEMPVFSEVVTAPAVPTDWEDETAATKSYLAQTEQRLKSEGFTVSCYTEYGPPAEVILRLADTVHADLIVMATHGRSGFARLWLGSVAVRVMQASTRPVLLVRAAARVVGREGVQTASSESKPEAEKAKIPV